MKSLTPPCCPVRGHDHRLDPHRVVTQRGTGEQATIWECPTGQYRWFCINGRELSDTLRMVRPRWGWKD